MRCHQNSLQIPVGKNQMTAEFFPEFKSIVNAKLIFEWHPIFFGQYKFPLFVKLDNDLCADHVILEVLKLALNIEILHFEAPSSY